MSGLWWWKQIEKWPSFAKGVFQDNWQRSAFYYEFQARLPEDKFDFWPFNVPWAWLGQRDRAALYCLWPPVLGKKYSIKLRPMTSNSVDQSRAVSPIVQLDISLPRKQRDEYIEKREQQYLKQIIQMPLGESVRKEEKVKWDLLEEMDRWRFLGDKVQNPYAAGRTRMTARYRSACNAVKLIR